MENCFFCNLKNGKIDSSKKVNSYILENELALGRYDDNPVNPGHMLFITKRHVETIFDTTPEEKAAIFELIDQAKIIIDKEFKPDGYNIGVNCGHSAGQTVMHIHVHLIPRYNGDIENPRGGVRGIIPEKRSY